METRYKYNGRGQKPSSNNGQQNQRDRDHEEEDHFYQQQNKRRQQQVFKEYDNNNNGDNNNNSNNYNNNNNNNFNHNNQRQQQQQQQQNQSRGQQRDGQNRNNLMNQNTNNNNNNNNNHHNNNYNNQNNVRQQDNNNHQRNQQNDNNRNSDFYPRNQNRRFEDNDDQDHQNMNGFRNKNQVNGDNKRNNRNNQQPKQQSRQNRRNNQNQESSDDYDDSFSESSNNNNGNDKRRNQKSGGQKANKKVDANGHDPNQHVDSQYDRSKIDHYYNNKDIKFSKEKRFNIYHEKDQEQYILNSKQNGQKKNSTQNGGRSHANQESEDYSIESIVDMVDFDIDIDDIMKEQNLDCYNWDDLYQLFKLSEKKNSHLYTNQKQGDDQVIFDKEEMDSEIFKFFSQLSRILILQDLDTASEKKIDQRLWDIYKKKIEQSKQLKLVSTNPQDQLHIFDSKIQFLRGILKDVIDKYKSELQSEIKQKNKKRRIIANLCCYFGELIELKEKVSRKTNPANIKNMHFAAGQYLKAISIYPYCGKFFLVLATLSYMSEDQFSAIYWCIRALYSDQSYPCKENLQEFLEINRQKCCQFSQEHNSYSQIDKKDYLKIFILHFLSYVNIVLTKIGIENMSIHVQMFEYLQKHTQYISQLIQQLQQSSSSQQQEEIDQLIKNSNTILNYVVMMIVFTLQKCQEFMKLKDNEVLTVKMLENDILASSCLKYTFGLLNIILELYVNTESKYCVDLVIPIICYFTSNHTIAEYLFSKYSQFQLLFNKILTKTKQRFQEYDNKKPRSYYENICDTCLCETEIQMIGYTPFNTYFETNKDKFKLLSDESLQYPIKLFIILDKLPKVVSFNILLDEEQNIQESNKQEEFFFLKNTPQKENKIEKAAKQVVIIDGMNVAIRYGQSTFTTKGLQIVVDFWVNHQTDVLIFLPDFCFSQDQIEKKRKKFLKEKQNDRLKTLPDEVETLLKLREQGYATGIPNWNYDDSYMIDYARKKDAFIMTNDRYNDHIQQFKNDPKQMEIVKQWIRNNCMSFTFVKDELQPDPDFIQKRTKICLDRPYQ